MGWMHMALQHLRLGYMAGMAGGYSLLGFLKNDVYNYSNKTRNAKIADGDANSAIVYLEEKVELDLVAIAKYVMNDDRLANLIWIDRASRVDYQYFGDVLVFDSTYKKNKYKKLVVIFSRSNNHKQTIIFGFRLLLNESVSSYRWMLENLLEIMCSKKSCVVVTNGDKDMIKVVSKVLPDMTHHLCVWHVEKNVTSNMKDEELRGLFRRWLYSELAIEEFEVDGNRLRMSMDYMRSNAQCKHTRKGRYGQVHICGTSYALGVAHPPAEGINAFMSEKH
ncbi:hypothetical protein AHAS_Ahas20G0142300 [Arachis hypogaea]